MQIFITDRFTGQAFDRANFHSRREYPDRWRAREIHGGYLTAVGREDLTSTFGALQRTQFVEVASRE